MMGLSTGKDHSQPQSHQHVGYFAISKHEEFIFTKESISYKAIIKQDQISPDLHIAFK